MFAYARLQVCILMLCVSACMYIDVYIYTKKHTFTGMCMYTDVCQSTKLFTKKHTYTCMCILM